MTVNLLQTFPDPVTAAQLAHGASIHLGMTKGGDRTQAVHAIADAIRRYQDEILEANTLDLEASREMAVPDLMLEWLKLTPERLQATVQLLHRLSDLPDPIGRIMSTTHQIEHCQTYSQLMPLGVIAFIYESLPELGAIATGLCLKTGNSIILKGGSEASYSNQLIAQAIRAGIEEVDLPEGCFQMLPSDQGTSIRDLVVQDQYVNLIIPYGRAGLVQQVTRQATAPVLRSAIGNCYLYWSPSGGLDAVRHIILDSHYGEPDPVNAIEKVLVHRGHSPSSLTMLWNSLRERGFEIRGDACLVQEFADLRLAEEVEWRHPYLGKIVAFKVVDTMEAAIAWINLHSSGHADCLVTESYQESRQFALSINSASTYINASPRFMRNSKRGEVFLGMSSQKGLRRGPIGMQTLTTLKHIVQGTGQV